MAYLTIDGSMGEGGGQVLRTSLSLAAIYGINIEIINIRAGRRKPGLMRQHLTSVLAAKQVCDAQVEGAELGSQRIRFKPGQIRNGNYRFTIGTAGSTTLVCQTVLPILLQAEGQSYFCFEGGTHNGMSPSLSFLERSFLPVMQSLGLKYGLDTERLGFFPAGGGRWQLDISTSGRLNTLCVQPPEVDQGKHRLHMSAYLSQLHRSIGQREIAEARRKLEAPELNADIHQVVTPGPGNTFMLHLSHGNHESVFETTGKIGRSAERVARDAVGRLQRFVRSGAEVEEHLADQLLVPLLLAGKGGYTTTQPTPHTRTNLAVIEQLTGTRIRCEQIDSQRWQITL